MKLYSPEHAGKNVWQCADAKTRAVSYTAINSTSPPPDACHAHPLGRYDSDGCYWSFCPNAGDEDPNSARSSRYAKHPQAEIEKQAAIKQKVWGSLNSFGSYKETDF
jgi:hypothetical protein